MPGVCDQRRVPTLGQAAVARLDGPADAAAAPSLYTEARAARRAASIGRPAEPAAVEIRDRTHDLVLGVHHERPVEHDRLIDRRAAEH
jgi:hypothetical protein